MQAAIQREDCTDMGVTDRHFTWETGQWRWGQLKGAWMPLGPLQANQTSVLDLEPQVERASGQGRPLERNITTT